MPSMKRRTRHAAVATLILATSSLGGMGLAVVAFGQDGQGQDATVPAGDYTGTTPTAPLSGYGTTTTPTVPTVTRQGSTTEATTTTGKRPARTHGTATVPHGTATLPSRATGSAPTRLAFTGGEPIVLGALGVLLMLSGLTLHRRRRARA